MMTKIGPTIYNGSDILTLQKFILLLDGVTTVIWLISRPTLQSPRRCSIKKAGLQCY